MEVLDFIISRLDTIGIVIVGAVLIYQRWTTGSSSLRKEINEEYKERNKQLEEKLTTCLNEIQKTNLVVAELKGIIQEKDKHIESLTKILQGRNPEMLEILKEIKEGNLAIQSFIKTTYALLEKSGQELSYQTEILEKSEERNQKIDLASKSHIGSPTLVPPDGSVNRITRRRKII